MKKINIILIRPKISYNKTFMGKTVLPPLNLLLLAAVTPETANVTIIDEIVEKISIPTGTDIIGITIPTTAYALRAYEIAKKFKKQGIFIVIGGMHSTFLPEEAIKFADTVVCGEAEETWPQLIEDFQSGNIKRIYNVGFYNSLTKSPIPRWDLIDSNNYIFPFSIQVTRGCHRKCFYCSVSKFYNSTHQCRSIKSVIQDIKNIKNEVKLIPIIDDNFFGNINYAKDLMKALIPLKIKWATQVPIEYFNDSEILDLAVRSGCSYIFTGIESISSKSLYESRRKKLKTELLKNIFYNLMKHDIIPFAHFIFGFDNDTPEVFSSTCNYAQDIGIPLVQFHILTPYPGTELYNKIVRQKRLLHNNWSLYDAKHVVFSPKKMSANELKSGFDNAWKLFYSTKSIYSRMKYLKDINSITRRKIMILNFGYKFFVGKHMRYHKLTFVK